MIALSAGVVPLLAEHPLLDSIREALTTGPQREQVWALAASAAALLAVIALAARFLGQEKRPARSRASDYLTKAVDLLGLTERDRRALLRAAEHAELEQPAAMLLSPANLAWAASQAARAGAPPETASQFDHICRRLFDCPLPQVESAADGAHGDEAVP